MYSRNCLDVDISPVISLSDVSVGEIGDIDLLLEELSKDCKVELSKVDGDMDLDIGIVCRTNVGTESYLRVLDGYLITIDGCKIKVLRQ